MKMIIALPLLFLLVAPMLVAQPQVGGQPTESALGHWRAERGDAWRTHTDEGTGYADFLYGASAQLSFQPQTEAEWFLLAREGLAETQAIHGIEATTLVNHKSLFLPLGMTGASDKVTVRLRQEVNGVVVVGGFVNVLFDARGKLLSVQTHALPGIANLSIQSTLAPADAMDHALEAFGSDTNSQGKIVADPVLVIAQVQRDAERIGVLAWRMAIETSAPGAQPEGFIYFVDARTGTVVLRENLFHEFDVGGTLRTRASPGLLPDSTSNPETQQVMRYARVQSPAGTVFTDASGNFNFAGVTGPLNCQFTYVGTFNDVSHQPGGDYTLTVPLTGTANSVLLNQTDDEFVTAQANAFITINGMRDWVRSINPFDVTADFVHTANVNDPQQVCNGRYDPTDIFNPSINFGPAGSTASATCSNTAYSTVIAHEDGHWLNDLYGTFNGADGMGEGNADVWAMYLCDTPLVGADLYGPSTFVRDGNNSRAFCGDGHVTGCYGDVHLDGEVWMGAAWKVRSHLNTALGNVVGDAVANARFLAWMSAYSQAQIRSVIEAQWLTLDDNDSTLANGTPHFSAINSGFRQQGFPGISLALFENFDSAANGTVPSGWVATTTSAPLWPYPQSYASVQAGVSHSPTKSLLLDATPYALQPLWCQAAYPTPTSSQLSIHGWYRTDSVIMPPSGFNKGYVAVSGSPSGSGNVSVLRMAYSPTTGLNFIDINGVVLQTAAWDTWCQVGIDVDRDNAQVRYDINGSHTTIALGSGSPLLVSTFAYVVLFQWVGNGYWDDTAYDTFSVSQNYCTAKVNSLGCTPFIASTGLPSTTGPYEFVITAGNVLNNKTGMMLWSNAEANTPFCGGTLCIAAPIIRTPAQNSGGASSGSDCSGVYSWHFTQAYMSSHSLTPGSAVFAQYWSRDPGFPPPNGVGLTDALRFVIGP